MRSFKTWVAALLTTAAAGTWLVLAAPPTSTTAGAGSRVSRPLEQIEIGPNKSLGGNLLFPADDAWNRDVSRDEVDANSAALIASMSPSKGLHPDFGAAYKGIPN